MKRALPCLLLIVGLLTGCASLPSLEGRPESTVLVVSGGSSPLADAVAKLAASYPGLTGAHPLRTGTDAFAARAALIAAARVSIDVQYYIWHDDITGRLMYDALLRAAERGVRVRLLLDDNNTEGQDGLLAALDAHPNVEVRLFNPFTQRGARLFAYMSDFSRLNRRMHNKSLTVDGAATIVGGRNIGDEYFAADEGFEFIDLDVLAAGAVVGEVAQSFDEYWASDSSYPVATFLPAATQAELGKLASLRAEVMQEEAAQRYIAAARDARFVTDLLGGDLDLQWVGAHLVVDHPAKALGQEPSDATLFSKIETTLGTGIMQDFVLLSPYFVPLREGADGLVALVQRGVRVRVLTNALESTDVAAVHSGYAKYRRRMLEGGIELYELRRRYAAPETGGFSVSGSAASLHAKTFSIDDRWLYIGSFNFDPRSVRHNTEIGLLLDSPAMAGELSSAFERTVLAAAYRVQLDAQGDLVWFETAADGTERRHDKEPGASFGRRLSVMFLSLLPIDSLL